MSNETKHTPGPWKIKGPSIECLPHTDGGDYAILSDELIIAETFERVAAGKAEPALANARLIAAAPELLEACEKLLKRAVLGLEQSASHDGLTNCKAIGRAIGAIAKAKGGKDDSND
jgi:hypothetical protein